MMQKSKRLLSLDTLRGFDMLFIMGGGGLFIALANAFPTPFFQSIAEQMEHVQWEGFRAYDLIFPLFLFIAGVSFPYSYDNKRAKRESNRAIYLDIVRRAAVLWLLGLVYNNAINFDLAQLRYSSVLGRIGIAWMLAAFIFINFKLIGQAIWSIALLVGFWLLIAFVPAPDAAVGISPFSLEGNIAGYFDRLLLPGVLKDGCMDNLGLLHTLPAVVTAQLGIFTGMFIKSNRTGIKEQHKVLILALAGATFLAVGMIWGQFFPIIKKLWTSSFVCVCGGISLLLFALFYYIIDIKGYVRWTLFFKVIGVNSITIYMAQRIVDFRGIASFFAKGFSALLPEQFGGLVHAVFYIGVCWAFLYFLYKQKLFLKV